jgi:hypothetical protein
VTSEDTVEILLETFTWLGLGIGLLSFVVLIVMRAIDGPWVATSAVIIPGTDPVEARWMTLDGALHSRVLDEHEGEDVGIDDDVAVYYCHRAPHRMRFGRRGHAERILTLLAVVFGTIGVACFVGALVFAFAMG